MLSTEYRLRMEGICNKIINGNTVDLTEMIWANKLAHANRSADTMLRQAQRKAQNPEMPEGGLDDFLNRLDIGGVGNESNGVSGFNSPEEIVDFFHRKERDDWRQRD